MKHRPSQPSRVYGSSPVVIAGVMTTLGVIGVAGGVAHAAVSNGFGANPDSAVRAGTTTTGPVTTSAPTPTPSTATTGGTPPASPSTPAATPTTGGTTGPTSTTGPTKIAEPPSKPGSSSPGRWVWVPDQNTTQGPKTFQLYKIRWGDTLSGISVRTGVPIATLVRDNNIKNPDLIYAGDVLRIPLY